MQLTMVKQLHAVCGKKTIKNIMVIASLVVIMLMLMLRQTLTPRMIMDCSKNNHRKVINRSVHQHGHVDTIDKQEMEEWNYQETPWIRTICKTSARFLFFVPIVVKKDLKAISAIHRTWGRQLALFNASIIFYTTQPKSTNASHLPHDVLVGTHPTLKESYENLSLKILSFLNWFSRCQRIQYLVKSDADTFWNIPHLSAFIESEAKKNSNRTKSQVLGWIESDVTVNRNISDAYYTSTEEYSGTEYPKYALGGSGYVLSRQAVISILKAAVDLPVFWLEDVYITGILLNRSVQQSETDVIYVHNPNFYYCALKEELTKKTFLQLVPISLHRTTPEEEIRLETWLQECSSSSECHKKTKKAIESMYS